MRADDGSGNCFLTLLDIILEKILLNLVPKRSVDRVSEECKMLGEQQHRRVVLELPPCAPVLCNMMRLVIVKLKYENVSLQRSSSGNQKIWCIRQNQNLTSDSWRIRVNFESR
jgi:hypothetical protein